MSASRPPTGGVDSRDGAESGGQASSGRGEYRVTNATRSAAPTSVSGSSPRLLDRVRAAVRVRHLAIRTEEAYVEWIRRFVLFHGRRHPSGLGKEEITRFLTWLAVERRVAASTQNQALCAILFLYRNVLGQDVPWLDELIWAKRSQRIPVVLSRSEAAALLSMTRGIRRLQASLLYGTGMRLLECLRLRVKDLDFDRHQICVRHGKGGKDRVTMFPGPLQAPMRVHLDLVCELHQRDLADGFGAVYLPEALDRKYPNAAREWPWQWVFPAARRSLDPRSGIERRHHQDESGLQKAVREAALAAGIRKQVGPHTLRHSFATDLLANHYDIRTIQQLLGHTSVETTMIYTHVLNNGPGVRSPLEDLGTLFRDVLPA